MKRKDIDTLHSDGLINDELRDKILAHYRIEEESSGRWLIVSLTLLAIVLLTGGAGMMVAAHWEELTMPGKAISGGVLLGGVWLLYLLSSKRISLLAEGLSILAVILWGGNLCLQELLFHTDRPFVEGLFLFFCGIVFIPFLTRQRILVGVTALTSLILLMLLMLVPDPESWLQLPRQVTENSGNTIASFLLLGVFWWLVGEKSCGSRGIYRGYYWISIPSFIAILVLLQSLLLYRLPYPICHHSAIVTTLPGYVMLAVTPALCLLLKPRGIGWFSWLLLALSPPLMTLLGIHLAGCHSHMAEGGVEQSAPAFVSLHTLYAVAACALYSIILMYAGTRSGRVSWVNYGSLMAIFTIIGVLNNIFHTLNNSAVALIVSGIILLVFALLMEYQRRRLIRKIKQQNTSTPPEA